MVYLIVFLFIVMCTFGKLAVTWLEKAFFHFTAKHWAEAFVALSIAMLFVTVTYAIFIRVFAAYVFV